MAPSQSSNGLRDGGVEATNSHRHAPTPLAITGYSCRLPGEVRNPEDLWQLCSQRRTGWSEIPATRFSKEAYWHPDPSKKGAFNPRGGYFLSEHPAMFDAHFFQVTAAEATAMDPQQRLLLETAFEALESAGVPRELAAGSDMGVFIGGSNVDYELYGTKDAATIPMYHATGVAGTMMSNRISYMFDLRGPSTTYDTACSSSLVALHHAALSLSAGECSSAIVGGCHLNLLPDSFVSMSMSQYVRITRFTLCHYLHMALGSLTKMARLMHSTIGDSLGSLVAKVLAVWSSSHSTLQFATMTPFAL